MKKASQRILFVLLLILCFSMVLPASAATTMNITSHDDGEIISWDDTFKLRWNKVTGASGYRVTIGITDGQTETVKEYLVSGKYTTSTYFTATSYLPEENCRLKVWVGAMENSTQAPVDAFTAEIIYLNLSHAPAITNGASSSITGNGATLKMSVDRDYGYAIEDCGFYVGTSSTVSKMTKYSFWDYSTSYGATSKGTKYMTISDLEPGTKYYYRAYAVNAAGEDYSSAKNFTTSKGSLGKPVITYPGDRITCYTGSDITLKWNSVSGADSYNYYIKQLSGTPNTNETDEAYVNKWEGSTTKRSYTLAADKLVPGYWYKFVVEACAADADSGWSAWHYVYVEKGNLEKAKIVSPSNTATYPGYQSIKFDWDDVPGADSYNYHIKRLAGIPDRTNDNEPSIGTPWTGSTTSTSYTLASSNVIPGSWYKFVVEAVSDTANPSWSEWVYCYIEEVKLVDPEIIKPTEWTEIYEGDSVVVDWDSVAGADGYRCHIKQLAGKPDTSNTNEPAVFSLKEDCGTATKFTLSGSKVHGGYWYKFVVEAYTKSGTSTWSDWVYVYVPEKGTLDRATISSPSDNKVYKWGEDILFTWAKVPNATNYTYYVKQLKGDPDYSSDEAAINSWSGTTNATNRFFTLSGDQVLPDVWYKFVVKAEADGYDSSWSKYTYIHIPDREDWIHAKLNTATSIVMAEAFANNQLLRTFDASESTLETIGARAFENCVNLRSIFLPSSVTSIADNTFSNCPQLTIHCYKDSYIHQYAVKKNIPVVLYGVVEQADMVELSKDSWTINFSEAAQAVFTVSSTGKWTASSSANWLTLSASSGLNATNVIFKAAANTGKTARTATVTFTCGKASATVTVSQSSVSGKACTMVLNHTSWMPSSSDLTREIVVKSEKGFNVSSNKTWLDYTTENAAILAKVTSSALNTTQTGTLTITCKNCGKAQTVTVAIKSVPAPTGVTASSDEPHAVVISWGKVADATYTIERSTNGTSGWTQIAKNLTSTKYVDGPNNINASATYYYRVTACKGTAYSGASAVVKATTPPEQTLTFTGIVGALGDNDRTALSSLTTLSWSSLADATYKLTLKDATTGDYVIDASGKKLDRCDVGSATSKSLSGLLTEGHTYQVWVGAYNNDKRLIGQAKVKTFSVNITNTLSTAEANRRKIIDRAEEWMNTFWRADGVPKYNKNANATYLGSNQIVHGVPYVGGSTASTNNYATQAEIKDGITKYRFTLENFRKYCLTHNGTKLYTTKQEDAQMLSVPPVMKIGGYYKYSSYGNKFGPANGSECVGFALECMKVVDPSLNYESTFSGQPNHFHEMVVTNGDYSKVVMADAIRYKGHVVLVAENHPTYNNGILDLSASYIIVYEQAAGAADDSKVMEGKAEVKKNCLCDYCLKGVTTTLGTRKSKYTYLTLLNDGYYYIDRLPACE